MIKDYSPFIQISVVREEEGDTIYALDDYGDVWSFWTGKATKEPKQWTKIPRDREETPI